ncbi:MAG TPA: SDR family NAD(P)-dependent oxidoreductase [Ferrovibrio sp.]
MEEPLAMAYKHKEARNGQSSSRRTQAMQFDNRAVVVTGGAGALGSAVVETLLQAGAHCYVPVRSGTVRPPQGDCVTFVTGCDLSSEAAVEAFYSRIPDLWASIHVAGGFAMSKLTETSKADFDRMLDTNLACCFLCCRAAARRFGAAGGRIVNVAARPALEPWLGAGMAAYTVSKAGVAALTAALAAELAERRILVNAVAPSTIDTPGNRAAMPKADHTSWVAPQAIARTIAFLASPDNMATSGAVLPVYGRA